MTDATIRESEPISGWRYFWRGVMVAAMVFVYALRIARAYSLIQSYEQGVAMIESACDTRTSDAATATIEFEMAVDAIRVDAHQQTLNVVIGAGSIVLLIAVVDIVTAFRLWQKRRATARQG